MKALDKLYQEFLMSAEVQKFAEDHSDCPRAVVSAVVSISIPGRPKCVLERHYDGYVLKNENCPT